MILCDFSKTAYSVVYAFEADIKKAECKEDIEGILRHAMISSITSIKRKFAQEFGKELIICLDGDENYRYKIFPNYKASRKKKRKESDLPWHMIFDVMNTIREEAKLYWPWKVIGHKNAEADDIMAVLVEEIANKRTTIIGVLDEEVTEPVVMDTGDNDMFQLHKYPNVKQYSTRMKKFIRPETSVEDFVKDIIICGDPISDGVPNILSNENCLVDGIRQTVMTKARKEKYMALSLGELLNFKEDPEIARRIRQNYQCVCFDSLDVGIRQDIVDTYNSTKAPKKMVTMKYLQEKKCNLLITMLGEM